MLFPSPFQPVSPRSTPLFRRVSSTDLRAFNELPLVWIVVTRPSTAPRSLFNKIRCQNLLNNHHLLLRWNFTPPRGSFKWVLRHAGKNGMYALGLEKEQEKRFKFPTDIVRYYQAHLLECSRASQVCTKLQLQPLPISDVLEARRPNAPAKTT